MSNTIQIPNTIEAAQAQLSELGRLLTAKGWERAAIVYAFTHEPGQGFRSDRTSSEMTKFSPVEFATLGINGLASHVSVSKHRRNWQQAIDDGWATTVSPGDTVILPTQDYPSTRNGGGIDDLITRDAPVEDKVRAVQEIVRQTPDVAPIALRQMLQDEFGVAPRLEGVIVEHARQNPTLAHRVRMASEEFHPTPMPTEIPRPWSLMAVGAAVYEAVRRQSDQVAQLAASLRARGEIDAQTMREVQDELDALGRARTLIGEYEDALRGAIGVDYDATFERLVNGGRS